MHARSERLARARARLPARRLAAAVCVGFVALALPFTADRASAAPERPDQRTTQVGQRWPIVGDSGSVELSGLRPRTNFEVNIPPGWAASAAGTLSLDYDLPELVETAALGVTLNGDFIDAVSLSPGPGTAEIELPADGFRSGPNSVQVEATIALFGDRECPDPWHPARIVTFDDTSRLEVPLVPVGPLLLDQLPEALEPVGLDARTITVRFAPEPSDEDLSAAAAVIAALRTEADLDVDVAVGTLGSGDRAVGPDVLVGVAADLAEAGYDVPAAPGGILQIGRNPSSNTRLIVSGSTPADVLAAARTVGASPAAPVVVGIEPGPAPVPPTPSERFTLADLGYANRDLTGPGVRSTAFSFDAALAVAPTSMSLVVDAVRTASAAEVSGLSVSVNGSRVGTVHFDVDTGATSGVAINVSSEDVRPGLNFLRIDAEFHGPSYDCEQRPPEESVEISSSTSIELITNEDLVEIDLEDLPYLLRAPDDSADLVVALPEDPSRDDLATAIDIAVTYGDERYPARIAQAGSLGRDDLVGLHVIAIGEPDVQPLHELLPDSIVATHMDEVISEQEPIEAAMRLNGVIEVVPNPVDPTRMFMLVTGFDADGADLASTAVLNRDLRGELYGRATFVGGSADNPLLAPVLEPVRIERAAVAERFEPSTDPDDTTTSLDDAAATSTIDDGTLLDEPVLTPRTELRSVPLGIAGLVGLGGLAVAGLGVLFVRRRRVEPATTGH